MLAYMLENDVYCHLERVFSTSICVCIFYQNNIPLTAVHFCLLRFIQYPTRVKFADGSWPPTATKILCRSHIKN